MTNAQEEKPAFPCKTYCAEEKRRQLPVRMNGLSQSTVTTPTINILYYLQGIEGNELKNLADFFSTGNVTNLNISENNIETYLYVANSLQQVVLKTPCENFCLKTLHHRNCLKYFVLAQTYNCLKLLNSALNMLRENFGSLWNTEEFQCLGKPHIMTLLQETNVHIHPDVESALKHWFVYETDFRRRSYHDMLAWLNNKINNNAIRTEFDSSVKQCSFDHAAIFAFTDNEKKPIGISINTKNFHICKTKHKVQQVTGLEFAMCSMKVDDAPYIYVTGGSYQTSRETLKYDVILNQWKSCKRMRFNRSRHVMAAVKERLYVLGGFYNGHHVPAIEVFNPYKKCWENAQCNLIQPVRSASCAVFDDRIYVFGGKTDDKTSLTTIQCFDPKTKSVRVVEETLPYTCNCGKAVAFGKHIFIASTQGHMFKFDPATEKVKICKEQPFKRQFFGMFNDSRNIYIAGGIGGTGQLSSVLAYDPEMDTWTHAGELPVAARVHGACVVNYGPFQDLKKSFHHRC